jgi:hypothetical protein
MIKTTAKPHNGIVLSSIAIIGETEDLENSANSASPDAKK